MSKRDYLPINENQKSVSKNLRTTLNADLLWDSENPTERNTALFSRIAQELGENTESPLFDRVIIGENKETVDLCEVLFHNGYFTLPIRPPTVPVGTSRLRLSLTSEIEENELLILKEKIDEVLLAK